MTDSAAPSAAPTTFSERDMRVTVAGVEIACRLTIPQDARAGAILLLPGSLYSDVDGDYPAMNMHPHTYADLADKLGGRGFVVLRMAKIGPGTGSKTVDPARPCTTPTFWRAWTWRPPRWACSTKPHPPDP